MTASRIEPVMFAVPVDQAHGSVVRQMVRRLLKEVGSPEEVADGVILALGEAFSNAVAHGTGSHGDQVAVWVWVERRYVTIELHYPGEPFDTRPPPVPSLHQLTGRGRYLMAGLMDAVTYFFPPGQTTVRLEKTIERAPG